MPIKVLLADDTAIVRDAIRRLFEHDPEIQLVAEATTLAQMIDIADKLHPHVIVMDLHIGRRESKTSMPLRSSSGIPPVVAISIWNDDDARTLADSLGAVTLLDKINLASELIPAIKRCVDPRTYTATESAPAS
ncbi:MAG: response regulator [Candidatus Acidiferrales bacterium]